MKCFFLGDDILPAAADILPPSVAAAGPTSDHGAQLPIPTHLPTHLPTYPLTYLPTYLPTYNHYFVNLAVAAATAAAAAATN
ncbi:hypothetical protein CSPX01_15772 [Colletotrichum filicis]|nr:hypothetical protein CSPX01_15772 [Colletotrichum filicis]